MAERRMLRQVMSPSDIYAHAETICDMLREHYGSYDADSLEEVFVDETFAQRLKARGYDLLGEGSEAGDVASVPPRRDVPRLDGGQAVNVRRQGGERSLPIRRPAANEGSVPMRRRDGATDTGLPLRRNERSGGDSGGTRRRDISAQSDGAGQQRRREGASQSEGVPLRRREHRAAVDASPSPSSADASTPPATPTPRRGWDAAREDAITMPARRENTPPSIAQGVGEPERAPADIPPPAQDMGGPVVEAPVQAALPPAETEPTNSLPVEAPVVEAPAPKPAPRTRRTARSRTKADPDTSAS